MSLVKLQDAKTEADRRAAIAAALEATGGNKSLAASLLGINRQHLHRLVPGPSRKEEAAAPDDDEIHVTLILPRRCVEWLEDEALKRKHAGEQSRMAKAPLVVEMIERAMAASVQGTTKAATGPSRQPRKR